MGADSCDLLAPNTQEIERKLDIRYSDPGFAQGLFTWDVGGAFFKNATKRFFGIGQRTSEDNETNYTAREFQANWQFGVYLNEVTRIAVGQRFREIEVQEGGADDLPFTAERFRRTDGVDGATILGHQLTFHYETRDNLITPTVGTLFKAYAEVTQNLRSSDHPFFYKYGLDVQALFPNQSKRAILFIRANIQTTFGKEIPFYEKSSLGGQTNLRGFGVDRFIDDHLVVLNVEERIHVLGLRLFNVNAEFEVAPFMDMGKVFHTLQTRQFQDYEITPGVGFRGIVRPNLVGRVDWGLSDEEGGGAVFAGLDYPF